MNLQVSIPYQPCIFNCPFCIARNHLHGNKFENLWEKDKEAYWKAYRETIVKNGISGVVITGECDPTQNMEFVREVVLNTPPRIQIEIQTKGYNTDFSDVGLDVIAFSIATRKEFSMARYFAVDYDNTIVVRATIILSKNFSLDDLDFIGFDQVTFKTLQFGEDVNVNKWIVENNFNDYEKLNEVMAAALKSGCSVRLDTNCMDSIGRYVIIRSDGKVYRFWSDLIPIQDHTELVEDKERGITMKTYVLNKDYDVKWLGVIPKDTEIEVLDDDTPLNNSWRCRVAGTERIFGIKKMTLTGITRLK